VTVSMNPVVAEVVDRLGSLAEPGASLGRLTTYRVGGAAAVLVRARSVDDLVRVGEVARTLAVEVLVVGNGSNLLVAESGFDGIVVQVALPEIIQISSSNDAGMVEASASVLLPVLARRTAATGLRGFEWAVGVPGSVGGAVKMNAGGHGSDMAASLISAEVVDLGRACVERLGVEALDLGFRSSNLSENQVVVGATLALEVGDRAESEQLISEIVRWRRTHQPGGQNCGSVFVNPVPGALSAAELIDAAGLRGLRSGSAEVSRKHANFIQADEDGSADDVHALIRRVRRSVYEASGYWLRTEVRLVGFGPDEPDPSEAPST